MSADILERLLDSEEYAVDEAVPDVAYTAFSAITYLRLQRAELLAALRTFVEKYDRAPDGELGIGLVNGDFRIARDAITKVEGGAA